MQENAADINLPFLQSPICFDTYNPAGRYDKIKDGISYLRNTGPFCIATYRPDAIIYQRVSCS